ncbi:MAG: S1/P1 nuclease, partial [Bacteroidota bacterium]
MKRFIIILFFWGLILPKPLMAWHSKGHQIVAEMAKSLLKKNILDSVQFYLDSTNFQQAAVWMDEVRKNPKFNYLKAMHYLNVAKDHTYVKSNEKNIINALEAAIQKLKFRNGSSKAEIKMQLLLLFHLIG